MILKRKNKGQGTTELALLLPILFALFLGAVQMIIYLQSSTMNQYASFMAARSFQVYGDRNLKSIDYRRVASAPYTNNEQTIVEAMAESILFESLMWEQRRIRVEDKSNFLDRTYSDGNNVTHNSVAVENASGAVQVNFICPTGKACEEGAGVDVTYCAPIVFPGIDNFFAAVGKQYPCKITQDGRTYSGIALTQRTEFGREPVEK